VSKTLGEWYQKTNKTEDTNKLTLLGLLDCSTAAIQQRVTGVLRSIPKEAFSDSFQKLYERCQPVL
jgi:hypothetical protein